jgi:Tol biopolymer transport system component
MRGLHAMTNPRFLLRFGAAIALAACGEVTPPRRTGAVTVVVNVRGNGADADGFTLTLGSRTASVQAGMPITLDSISPGSYTLHLGGLAPQCSTEADTESLTVAPGLTASVRFVVTCYGGIAFGEVDAGSNWQVFYLGEDGRLLQLTRGPGKNLLEDWSPDGKRVVFESDRNGNMDLYSVRIDGTDLRQLTTHPYQDLQPRWSPDGQSITFHRTQYLSGQFTQASLLVVNADGTGERVLLDTLKRDFDPTWTPDGSTIVFSCDRFGDLWDLCAVAPNGTGLRRILYSSGAQHAEASPDGRRVGFQSFDGGQAIWAAALDGSSAVNLTPGLVSYDFGWSPDGTQLVVETYDGQYLIQRVNRDGTGLSPLTPAADAAADARWSPDGARIVFYSQRGGQQQIWVMKPDGSDMHPITTGAEAKFHPRWNPKAKPIGSGAVGSVARAVAPTAPVLPSIKDRTGRGSLKLRCVRAPGQVFHAVPCRP